MYVFFGLHMLQTAIKTWTAWVADTSFHVTYTRFWLRHLNGAAEDKPGSTASIQAVSHSGSDGHHEAAAFWLADWIHAL